MRMWDHMVCQPLPCPSGPDAAFLCVLSVLTACLCPSYQSGLMFLLYLLGYRTSIQFDFLAVLVVILLLVVQGSEVYLPTPSSWPEA